MGNGDPVEQQQFYETMDKKTKEVLDAVATVNGHVQENSVKLGVVETKLDTHEKRMNGQDDRMKIQDDKIEDQKKWNRGLAAVEGLLATVLVALGIRGD